MKNTPVDSILSNNNKDTFIFLPIDQDIIISDDLTISDTENNSVISIPDSISSEKTLFENVISKTIALKDEPLNRSRYRTPTPAPSEIPEIDTEKFPTTNRCLSGCWLM